MMVDLTLDEMTTAGIVGLRRHIRDLKLGHHHNWHGDDTDGWDNDIVGAMAEQAVARVLNRYWAGGSARPDYGGDVDGHWEVRWTKHPKGHLLVHPDDHDVRPYVLVTGLPPRLDVVGSMKGRDAKDAKYWKELTPGRPAFCVPYAVVVKLPLDPSTAADRGV